MVETPSSWVAKCRLACTWSARRATQDDATRALVRHIVDEHPELAEHPESLRIRRAGAITVTAQERRDQTWEAFKREMHNLAK